MENRLIDFLIILEMFGITTRVTSPRAHNISSAYTSVWTFHLFGWITSTVPIALVEPPVE
jgi:hypothetical protein